MGAATGQQVSGTFCYRSLPRLLPRIQAVHGMQVMQNAARKVIVNELALRVRPPVLLAPDPGDFLRRQ
jgi:hypothetical protein